MNSKIAVGEAFPDYELPDHTRTPRKLSALQGEGVLAHEGVGVVGVARPRWRFSAEDDSTGP